MLSGAAGGDPERVALHVAETFDTYSWDFLMACRRSRESRVGRRRNRLNAEPLRGRGSRPEADQRGDHPEARAREPKHVSATQLRSPRLLELRHTTLLASPSVEALDMLHEIRGNTIISTVPGVRIQADLPGPAEAGHYVRVSHKRPRQDETRPLPATSGRAVSGGDASNSRDTRFKAGHPARLSLRTIQSLALRSRPARRLT